MTKLSPIVILAHGALITAGLSLWISSTWVAVIAIGLACLTIALGIRYERAVVIGAGILAVVIAKITLVFTTNLSIFLGLNR